MGRNSVLVSYIDVVALQLLYVAVERSVLRYLDVFFKHFYLNSPGNYLDDFSEPLYTRDNVPKRQVHKFYGQ